MSGERQEPTGSARDTRVLDRAAAVPEPRRGFDSPSVERRLRAGVAGCLLALVAGYLVHNWLSSPYAEEARFGALVACATGAGWGAGLAASRRRGRGAGALPFAVGVVAGVCTAVIVAHLERHDLQITLRAARFGAEFALVGCGAANLLVDAFGDGDTPDDAAP